jgi:preprotein translocase subunit SecA
MYETLGTTVAAIQQGQSADERRRGYRAGVTYATANEVGFDRLRDGLALEPDEQVHRGLHAAIVDEADSILIDEARLPLVIAGGIDPLDDVALQADRAVRELVPGRDYTVGESGRNVLLTPAGAMHVERAIGCENLYDAGALAIHAAVQDALHAHVLLHRDVAYLVMDGAVVAVDESPP